MEIVGVTKTRANFGAFHARDSGFKLFAVSKDHLSNFEEAGLATEGTLEDLLGDVDVIVDCAPGKRGAANAKIYNDHNVKAIWQGGEKNDLVEASFNSLANYKDSWGKDRVRVVSCNTTGLCRTLYPIYDNKDGYYLSTSSNAYELSWQL